MGDVGEAFEGWSEYKRVRRANNTASSTEILIQNGVAFESKNGGAHLVVKAKGQTIDFWPSTGLWCVRGSAERRRGVFKLLKLCRD